MEREREYVELNEIERERERENIEEKRHIKSSGQRVFRRERKRKGRIIEENVRGKRERKKERKTEREKHYPL